ncbi:hypothetical protein ACWD4A_35045, partial [Streptomyces sp. NPDC002537]
MTHAPGSPRAARSGAAEAPLYDLYDPYDPATPYGAYAPYVPYAATGDLYGLDEPVAGPYDPFLPEPREAAAYGREPAAYEPQDLHPLPHLPRQPTGPDTGSAPADDDPAVVAEGVRGGAFVERGLAVEPADEEAVGSARAAEV